MDTKLGLRVKIKGDGDALHHSARVTVESDGHEVGGNFSMQSRSCLEMKTRWRNAETCWMVLDLMGVCGKLFFQPVGKFMVHTACRGGRGGKVHLFTNKKRGKGCGGYSMRHAEETEEGGQARDHAEEFGARKKTWVRTCD